MPSTPSSEVLIQFDTTLTGPDHRQYVPRACARKCDDGRWEGWIEFIADDGSVSGSPRETVQPNHTDVTYWAGGLTVAYLEGALQRTLDAEVAIPRVIDAGPPVQGPAPTSLHADSLPGLRAAFDPFKAYAQGEQILRQQLRALDVSHLAQIVKVYELSAPSSVTDPASRAELEAVILLGVRKRMGV